MGHLCYVISICDLEQQRLFTKYMALCFFLLYILNVIRFFAKEKGRKMLFLSIENVPYLFVYTPRP